MSRWSAMVVVLVCAAGCSPAGKDGKAGPAGRDGVPGEPGAPGQPGAAGKDSTADGSRLKARYLVATDGARTAGGWFDKTLNVECKFVTASDGKTRCMPDETSMDIFYNDVPCIGGPPVVAGLLKGQCGGGYQAYALVAELDTLPPCNTPYYRAYAIGAMTVAPLPDTVWKNSGGCPKLLAQQIPNYDSFYEISELQPAEFVEASVQ